MPVTIRDVARRAGVGIATVSRVINRSASVSEETRNRVLQAIEELNFTPNPIARRLSTGRTLTIGVIVPFFTMPDFVKRLQGVQSALVESEYDLVLFNVESPAQRDKYYQEIPRQARVDGLLIITLSVQDAQIEHFHKNDMPFVLVDAHHPQANRIIVNHVEGGEMATRHLLELGHRKIAFVSDYLENPFNFPATRQRHEGYRRAMQAFGIDPLPKYHQQGEHGREVARQLARNLFALPDSPTAIFASTDTQAIGILEAARQEGIQVPQKLSVMGYSDLRDAEYLNLTTIHQPLRESGVQGVELLLEIIESQPQEIQEISLPVDLVVRGTTARPAH